jgi:hypothetical protein
VQPFRLHDRTDWNAGIEWLATNAARTYQAFHPRVLQLRM